MNSTNLKGEQVIDVSPLLPGVYLVVVVDSNKVFSGKLVIL